MPFPSPSQIAWMAALYEGEGYVAPPKSRSDKGSKQGLRLRFKMCDRDVLERFLQYAGGGNLSGPHNPSGLGKQQTYTLVIQGIRAYALLAAFWPWLGIRRQHQVKTALVKFGTMVPTHMGRIINRADAEQIKIRLAAGSHGIGRRLADEYGITDGMISNIKNGRAWI